MEEILSLPRRKARTGFWWSVLMYVIDLIVESKPVPRLQWRELTPKGSSETFHFKLIKVMEDRGRDLAFVQVGEASSMLKRRGIEKGAIISVLVPPWVDVFNSSQYFLAYRMGKKIVWEECIIPVWV